MRPADPILLTLAEHLRPQLPLVHVYAEGDGLHTWSHMAAGGLLDFRLTGDTLRDNWGRSYPLADPGLLDKLETRLRGWYGTGQT